MAAYGGFNQLAVPAERRDLGAAGDHSASSGSHELNDHLLLFYTGIKRTASDVAQSYVQRTRRQQAPPAHHEGPRRRGDRRAAGRAGPARLRRAAARGLARQAEPSAEVSTSESTTSTRARSGRARSAASSSAPAAAASCCSSRPRTASGVREKFAGPDPRALPLRVRGLADHLLRPGDGVPRPTSERARSARPGVPRAAGLRLLNRPLGPLGTDLRRGRRALHRLRAGAPTAGGGLRAPGRRRGRARTCATPAAVDAFFARERPEYVFLLGGRSGGIARNQREPADLMLDNLRIETAVLDAAHRHGVREAALPGRRLHLPARVRAADARRRSSARVPLEPTSEAYATAKWAGPRALPRLRAPVRRPLHRGDPGQPLRPGRRRRDPQDAHVVERADAPRARGREKGDARSRGLGHRDAAPRLPLRRRPRRRAALPDAALRRETSRSTCRAATERLDRASSRSASSEVVGFAGRLRFDASRPDGAPRKALDGRPLRGARLAPRHVARRRARRDATASSPPGRRERRRDG